MPNRIPKTPKEWVVYIDQFTDPDYRRQAIIDAIEQSVIAARETEREACASIVENWPGATRRRLGEIAYDIRGRT